MSRLTVNRVHPVVEVAQVLGERLDGVVDVPCWSMTPEEKRIALVDIVKDEAKLAALKLRVLTEADRSGATDDQASGTAADWLAAVTQQSRGGARADLKLGRKLEKHSLLATFFDHGLVNQAQARVIADALDRLPLSGGYAVSAEQLHDAETHLVAQAAEFDADTLKRLGYRTFEVVAPDLAEAWEGRKLEAQEAKALRKSS